VHRLIGEKDDSAITDEGFWTAMLANGCVQHRQVGFSVLATRDCRRFSPLPLHDGYL